MTRRQKLAQILKIIEGAGSPMSRLEKIYRLVKVAKRKPAKRKAKKPARKPIGLVAGAW